MSIFVTWKNGTERARDPLREKCLCTFRWPSDSLPDCVSGVSARTTLRDVCSRQRSNLLTSNSDVPVLRASTRVQQGKLPSSSVPRSRYSCAGGFWWATTAWYRDTLVHHEFLNMLLVNSLHALCMRSGVRFWFPLTRKILTRNHLEMHKRLKSVHPTPQ